MSSFVNLLLAFVAMAMMGGEMVDAAPVMMEKLAQDTSGDSYSTENLLLIIGGIVLSLVIVALVFCLCRRKAYNQQIQDEERNASCSDLPLPEKLEPAYFANGHNGPQISAPMLRQCTVFPEKPEPVYSANHPLGMNPVKPIGTQVPTCLDVLSPEAKRRMVHDARKFNYDDTGLDELRNKKLLDFILTLVGPSRQLTAEQALQILVYNKMLEQGVDPNSPKGALCALEGLREKAELLVLRSYHDKANIHQPTQSAFDSDSDSDDEDGSDDEEDPEMEEGIEIGQAKLVTIPPSSKPGEPDGTPF